MLLMVLLLVVEMMMMMLLLLLMLLLLVVVMVLVTMINEMIDNRVSTVCRVEYRLLMLLLNDLIAIVDICDLLLLLLLRL